MYSFFVLGLIPGTNFQITFQVWLDGLLLAVEAVGVLWLYRRHQAELAPYLHIPPALLPAFLVSQKIYRNLCRQLKAFLDNQAASWEAL